MVVVFCLGSTHVGANNNDDVGGVQKSEYTTCLTNAFGVSPEIMLCAQAEIERYKKNIENRMATSAEDELTSVLKQMVSRGSRQWLEYSEGKCAVYDKFEGQRGELLKVNCLLDEFIRRDAFIKNLILEAELS
ncbi:hypothetical protein D3C84_711530 [compost metagenome]